MQANQWVGRAKTGLFQDSDMPACRTWLVSHVPQVWLRPTLLCHMIIAMQE